MKFKKKTKNSSNHVCTGCGTCCRNFPYIRLTQEDIKTLENFTGLSPEEFTSSIDKTGEKRFMKFKENGDCIFLNKIDGDYLCSVYEARTVICREYPSTEIQKKQCRANSER